VGIAFGAVLAVVMGVMLGKGPAFEPGVSPVLAVAENIAVYFLGGPAGFAQVMGAPTTVGEPGLSLRFFTQLARSLGADIALPDNILGYYREGMGNVYTIYFAYWLDGGWWGVVIMTFVAGALCTSVYVWARRGNPLAGAAFGLVTGSILTSTIGDGIFGSSVPWLLLLAVVGLLWSVPTVSIRFTRQPTSLPEDLPNTIAGSQIYRKGEEGSIIYSFTYNIHAFLRDKFCVNSSFFSFFVYLIKGKSVIF
jgi:hypothetical protein